MTPLIGIAVIAILLLLWAVFSGSRSDKEKARASEQAAAFQQRAATDPDWALTERARAFGIALDLAADTVTVPGQAVGRFTGSLVRIETAGQLSRRVTLSRVALIGVFALAAQKQQDDRELYLTVEGDGFQLAAHVVGNWAAAAHEFAALYNTRSGALAQPSGR